MKAEELRIGNLILINVDEADRVLKLSAIEKDCIQADLFHITEFLTTSVSCGIENLFPVPLTEEWLKKFEFEKKGESFYDKEMNFRLDFFAEDSFAFLMCYTKMIAEGDSIEEFVFINDVKYAHQLQNLYFALVGEELKLVI